MTQPEIPLVNDALARNRAHLKTGGQQRREVLKLDFAGNAEQKMQTSITNQHETVSRNILSHPGFHTEREQQRVMSPMSMSNATSAGPRTVAGSAFPRCGAKGKTTQSEKERKNNFAITQAKPSLFKPIKMETVKVDSYVKACQVANIFSKPGKSYQTTQSLVRLNNNGDNSQRGMRMHRNREQFQLESQFSQAGEDNEDPEYNGTRSFAQPYRKALSLNR